MAPLRAERLPEREQHERPRQQRRRPRPASAATPGRLDAAQPIAHHGPSHRSASSAIARPSAPRGSRPPSASWAPSARVGQARTWPPRSRSSRTAAVQHDDRLGSDAREALRGDPRERRLDGRAGHEDHPVRHATRGLRPARRSRRRARAARGGGRCRRAPAGRRRRRGRAGRPRAGSAPGTSASARASRAAACVASGMPAGRASQRHRRGARRVARGQLAPRAPARRPSRHSRARARRPQTTGRGSGGDRRVQSEPRLGGLQQKRPGGGSGARSRPRAARRRREPGGRVAGRQRHGRRAGAGAHGASTARAGRDLEARRRAPRSGDGGRSWTRPRRPTTDTRARARDQPGSAVARARRRIAAAGERQRAGLGGVARQHARVADREQLEQPPAPPQPAAGPAQSARWWPVPRSLHALIGPPSDGHRGHPRPGPATRRSRIGDPHPTRARAAVRQRSTYSPRSSDRGSALRAAARGLAPTASARAAARAAFARTARACGRPARAATPPRRPGAATGTTATSSTEAWPASLRKRAHAPDGPARRATRDNAPCGYGSATRSGGTASRPSRARTSTAPAARTRPSTPAPPSSKRRSVATKVRIASAERPVQRQPDVRVERVDVEPVLAVQPRSRGTRSPRRTAIVSTVRTTSSALPPPGSTTSTSAISMTTPNFQANCNDGEGVAAYSIAPAAHQHQHQRAERHPVHDEHESSSGSTR